MKVQIEKKGWSLKKEITIKRLIFLKSIAKDISKIVRCSTDEMSTEN